jgi:hypothetical protein
MRFQLLFWQHSRAGPNRGFVASALVRVYVKPKSSAGREHKPIAQTGDKRGVLENAQRSPLYL